MARNAQEVMRDIVVRQLAQNMATEANDWKGSGISRLDYVSSPTSALTWVQITTADGDLICLELSHIRSTSDTASSAGIREEG